MNNNEFINKYTDGHCLSYLEFQVVAKKYGIYFEKINNDIIVCYDGEEDPKVAAFKFYKTFFPETTLTPSDFDLIIHLNNFHMKFLRDKINEISQKYGMPPVYKASMSIRENVLSLLNTLKTRYAIYREDMEFIKYSLNL
ncbi:MULTISPECIES: hypothetical protein [Fusobacterium]|jgi:hypothetical protein|uniref:Uncharacterized protein n=1 Tax=Fusobacterium pseudoperiodonticum TaxID=2663009 RepID=A0A2D3PTJ1_9FUSO|nr:hypothetical protein [Fusobacterium pseudoperiodonticum]MBF1198002.1 hypothetical protein [Fusobacterium periodonticum]ATV58938.1 hypothetical protein CTM72_03710 [Fusobacterium pseudoperiodonticum]ATV71028.1 hypothetical protein CTM98_10415 [Fusobacterium pseudoperiodonticum]MBF1206183.1 hypothetical protein [Fusobacterium periodonticum]MBF1207791.1 hypothetical protein [Fusobacterium periodonticum]